MNKEQYNNIIDRTLADTQLAQAGDSLTVTRAILNNMGIALPNGTLPEVAEVLKTNEYMGWRECTPDEARQAAMNGVATVAISDESIMIVPADDGEEPAVQTRHVAMAPQDVSDETNAETTYYANSAAGTTTWRKAIIIVPGVMGTELQLGEAYNEYDVCTKIWPPIEPGEGMGVSIADKLMMLRCAADGSSILDIRVRNSNNYGANNTYKTLYEEMKNEFSPEYEVVFFGYDWRQANSTSGEQLKNLVFNYNQVVIIAHSMGGIVTSHMLMDETVRNRVAKVITIGTPFLGSLDMLPAMTHGELELISEYTKDLDGFLGWLLTEAAQTLIKSLAVNIPSLYELLPNRKFFDLADRWYYSECYIIGGDTPITNFDNTQDFLRHSITNYNLALAEAATNRNDSLWVNNSHVTATVNAYHIIGEGFDTKNRYKHFFTSGNFETYSTNSGDGTVLSYSACMNDIYPARTYFAHATHGGMVSAKSNPNVIGFIKSIIKNETPTALGISGTSQNGI